MLRALNGIVDDMDKRLVVLPAQYSEFCPKGIALNDSGHLDSLYHESNATFTSFSDSMVDTNVV